MFNFPSGFSTNVRQYGAKNYLSDVRNEQFGAKGVQQVASGDTVTCPPGLTGRFPHPSDCTKFLNCFNNRTFVHDCGPGTAWNRAMETCDHMAAVNCHSTSFDSTSTSISTSTSCKTLFSIKLLHNWIEFYKKSDFSPKFMFRQSKGGILRFIRLPRYKL